MDISAIVVILVLTALFFGSVIWIELHSRRDLGKRIPGQPDVDANEVGG